MNPQQAGEMFEKVRTAHAERMERWSNGRVTISEVVERMTCKACDKGINLDGQPCEFCEHGLTIFPAAADALRFLAKQERDGMQRLVEELQKIRERRERRRAKQAAKEATP